MEKNVYFPKLKVIWQNENVKTAINIKTPQSTNT